MVMAETWSEFCSLNNMALSFKFFSLPIGGALALSERPKIKETHKLKAGSCTHVVTILAERGEKARLLGKEVQQQSMTWHWLKISKITALTHKETSDFKTAINETLLKLKQKEHILVHCSAGLHRTGIFAYVLLRRSGLTHIESLHFISHMKPETANALMEVKYANIAENLLKTNSNFVFNNM